MKNIVIGILAHVDAGKTTLSEAMLYSTGEVDRAGRVDKGDTHLDTHTLERERGITIFSKQTTMYLPSTHLTLLDTPGHVDFSCECERVLSVLDYAVLVVSATDGIRAHTATLWGLLKARGIPTVIFVNKTDISDRRRTELLAELKLRLSNGVVSFTDEESDEFYEEVAGCDVSMMERYFEGTNPTEEDIAGAIRERKLFPCLFGAALKHQGVRELLSLLDRYTRQPAYSKELFGARIYKIARDDSGRRVTLAKITGGSLRPKEIITVRDGAGVEYEEKVEELRIFTHSGSRPLKLAEGGMVAAIYGPTHTHAGGGLGFECEDAATLAPVLDYRVVLEDGTSPYEAFGRLSALAEEDPQLSIRYDGESDEIRISLMGEIQGEVLTRIILDRFSLKVRFDDGQILYKETIRDTVVGRGHFEPLRHYAEVHFELSPLPEGSGIVTENACPRDTLAASWQRLILGYIDDKVHKGKLIGAPLTDVKITLLRGKAHLKHTDAGDFRKATYRAIRQGVMKSECVLLEPTFDFRMEIPKDSLGRAMTDISSMHGSCEAPIFEGEIAILEGNCPVATIRSYPSVLRTYTHGAGKIALTVGPLAPCHNAEEVIAERGYDPEADAKNLSSSVFCKAGAGYSVPWYEADALMHMKSDGEIPEDAPEDYIPPRARASVYRGTAEEDKELMRIFEATYGKVKPRSAPEKKENSAPEKKDRPAKQRPKGDDYIVIDGYNVIYAIEELRRTAEGDFALARDVLIRMTCDYCAFRKCRGIIVFDAYRRKGGEGSEETVGAVRVIYTKEGQTADSYIERETHELAKEHTVRVVTSDLEEQNIVLGNGALRVSTEEFRREMECVRGEIREAIDYYKVRRK